MQKITLFFQESVREFKRVNWPTSKETIRMTVIVIVFSLAVSLFLGVFDLLFLYGLDRIILYGR